MLIARAVFSLFLISLLSPARADPRTDLQQTLGELLRATQPHAFSGGVRVEQAGEPLYTYAGAPDDRPTPTLDSQYLIGSLSKQITATLVLREISAGRLTLDTTLDQALPDLQEPWADKVSIAQLLDHTAGINGPGQVLQSRPGQRFAYTNWGYELLGRVVAQRSGQTYASQASALFKLCGMDHSKVPDSGTVADMQVSLPKLLGGEVEQADGWLLPSTRLYLQAEAPAGGLVSTLGDLAAWNRCLHGGPALQAAQYQAMTQPAPSAHRAHRWGELGYGYGLQVLKQDGWLEYSHSGYIGGYIATLLAYPRQQLNVVILENTAWRGEDPARAFAFHDRIRAAVQAYLATQTTKP
ncbi:serine hydrolase domain-containing protein [Chitinimonas naiadis]